MSNYKFHIDKPLPDAEQINRHKDFGRLYGRYETAARFGFWRKLFRSPRWFASIVLLAVVVWLVFDAGKKEKVDDGPLIQPQMELTLPFQQVGGSGQFRRLTSLADFFIRGIPLTFEENGVKYWMHAEEIVERQGSNFFPSYEADSDSVYVSDAEWFVLNMESGIWEKYQHDDLRVDSAFLLFGKKEKWPEADEQKIRLLDDQKKNLSRELGKRNRKAFLVLSDHKTFLPLGYDGEGKHILPFVLERGVIWSIDADGKWWNGDLSDWAKSEEIDLICREKI